MARLTLHEQSSSADGIVSAHELIKSRYAVDLDHKVPSVDKHFKARAIDHTLLEYVERHQRKMMTFPSLKGESSSQESSNGECCQYLRRTPCKLTPSPGESQLGEV